MNELKYKGLTVAERVIVYFELARDATLIRTYAEMITAALALIYLLQDADIDRRETAERLSAEARRCGINDAAIVTAIDNLAKGGER